MRVQKDTVHCSLFCHPDQLAHYFSKENNFNSVLFKCMHILCIQIYCMCALYICEFSYKSSIVCVYAWAFSLHSLFKTKHAVTTCVCVNVNFPWSRSMVLAGVLFVFLKWSKVFWKNQRLSDPFAQQGLLLCGEVEALVSLENLDPPLIHHQVHLCALFRLKPLSGCVESQVDPG